VVLDGGMNHHLAASGNLGMVIRRNFPVAVATRLDAARDTEADVVGPLCTPLDALGRGIAVPDGVAEGDLVAVLQSGAYGRSASPLGFLSHEPPAEVWVG
jgi:diaminopimelate decarboxylase